MRQRIKYALLVLLILAGCKKADRTGALFLIFENGKYGYINVQGHVVIPAIFYAADNFSEGLAAVRQDGTYGYIDSTGEFVIASQYDFADPFSDGVAQVYRNDSSFFIDRTGKQLFHHTFANMQPFINGQAVVKTASGKMGIINKQGKLIVDTLYNSITPTKYGCAIVYYGDTRKCGIIDTTGKIIVPFDRYAGIEAPTDGYYQVTFFKAKERFAGFIDTAFQLRLSKRDSAYTYGITGEMYNGLAQVTLHRAGVVSGFLNDEYMDYIGLDGKTIIDDKTVDYAYPFRDNRAFVKYTDGKYGVVNTKGEKVSSLLFDAIDQNETFNNGLACVTFNGKQGVIDTDAHFIIKPEFVRIKRQDTSSDYFMFKNDRADISPAGIVERNGQIILPPVLQHYNYYGFVNGLLGCVIQDRPAYIDRTGRIIWRGAGGTSLHNMNCDAMLRTHFHADGIPEPKNPSYRQPENGNYPISIRPSDDFPMDDLSLVVATTMRDTFNQRYNGFKVFLVNDYDKPLSFGTTDNILDMKVQAFTQNKKWEDIEYSPHSWGRSSIDVTLMPHQYWQFECPVFDGAFKTKLRIALKIGDLPGHDDIIYSNEFEGGINPGQLWRKPEYTSSNIMRLYSIW